MRFDGKSNPQKAGDISITKLSNVVRPAHEGAVATIIKSAAITTADVKKKGFNQALADIGIGDFYDSVWDMTWAIRDSIFETIEDSEIENKKEIIQNNIDDFANALGAVVSANTIIKQGESNMKKEEIDAMIKAAMVPLNDELSLAKAIAKMNDLTKAHYDVLTDDAKGEFIKMSIDDQIIAAKPVEKTADESFEMGGMTILKSAVGESTFTVMKAQSALIEQQTAELKKEKETRQMAEYAKMADGLYPNLPGESLAKGNVIACLKSMDATTQETLEAMLKAGNSAMEKAAAFKSIGYASTDPAENSPESKLNKLAEDRASKDSISFAKAYDLVLRTEAGQDLYEESLKA